MALELIDIIIGVFSAIFVVINLIVGLKIASKYFSYNKWELLSVGISWIILAAPWIPDMLKPIYIVIDPMIQNNSIILINYIFNVLVIPFAIILWMIAFTQMLEFKKYLRYVVNIIIVLINLIFQIIIGIDFVTEFIAGSIESYGYISLYLDIYLIIGIAFVLITGLWFASMSIKSSDKEVTLKGKILIIAFILFTIGAFIDAIFRIDLVNIISRSILVLSSVMFYLGFILPEWAKKKLL